jgi:hypothetical protein
MFLLVKVWGAKKSERKSANTLRSFHPQAAATQKNLPFMAWPICAHFTRVQILVTPAAEHLRMQWSSPGEERTIRARRREGYIVSYKTTAPPAFVSALENLAETAMSNNRLSRDFQERSIFDFYNSAQQRKSRREATARLQQRAFSIGRSFQPAEAVSASNRGLTDFNDAGSTTIVIFTNEARAEFEIS